MKITENAIEKLKTIITRAVDQQAGIRISVGNGCCGPSIGLSLVRQPQSADIKQIHEGINFYIDSSLKDFDNDIVLDFQNEYFNLTGIPNQSGSGCC